MRLKKIMLITLLLLAVLTISAVSANENLTDDELQVDSSDEIEISDDADIISSTQDEIVKGTDNGTFTALQNKISEAEEGSTITLENNYTNDDGFSTNGITISKSLTIDGKGYTIDANSQSRIFKINASNVVLKNIKFTNGYTGGSGGAIYNTGANFTVDSCTFTDCYSEDYSGGAICNTGTNFTVDSCTFNNCSAGAGEYGGAILNNNGTDFTVSSCNFTGCSAGNYGGAIYTQNGDNFTVDSCNFNNCSAWYGGAILNNNGADFTVSSCNFTGCSAGDNGGAIYTQNGDNFTVISCTFNNCSATSYYGGAIYTQNGDNFTVISCNFNNCSARYGGAILNNHGANCTVNSCTFTNCRSVNSMGGAIYNEGDDFTVDSCNFNNCSAWYGGAIRNSGDYCTVDSCTFNNCSASEISGAIYNSGNNCTINTCNCNGGAIYNSGNNCIINTCNFTDCSAERGGAIYNTGTNCSVDSCTFNNCSAKEYGGTIYNYKGANFTVDSCTFNNCSASWSGGTIYNYNGVNFNVKSCTFTKCSSSSYGGAIGNAGADCSINSCNFINCNAIEGEAIYSNANLNINSCIFADLTRGEAIKNYYNTNITNCTFKKGTDPELTAYINFSSANLIIINTHAEYSGTVTVNILNTTQTYYINIVNGSGNATIKNLLGNYTAVITSNYWKKFDESNVTLTFKIKDPELKISIADYDSISTGLINITTNAEYSGTVTVNILNTTKFVIAVVNGSGSHTIRKNILPVGNYRAVATSSVNIGFGESNATTTFEVIKKLDPNLTISVANITEGSDAIIAITTNTTFSGDVQLELQKGYYWIIGSGSIFVITNTTYYNISVVNGVGSKSISNLSASIYHAYATFAETEIFSESTKTTQFEVTNETPSLKDPELTISVASITQGANAVITITTNAAFTGSVNVKIGSANYVVSVVNGKGTKSVSGLAVGTYTATAIFSATDSFSSSTKSTTFKVTKKADTIKLTLTKVKVKKSAKKLVIKATLKINSKAVKGKKITFKFNKKTYEAKTNIKGIAQITIKKAALKKLKVGKKVTYTAKYSTKTVKKTVKVKK